MAIVGHPLKPAGYISRNIDLHLQKLLSSYTIVELEGVLGCGKNWLALAHSQSATNLSDTEIVLPIVQAEPLVALSGVAPHSILEWSHVPQLSELIYREARSRGAFITTTSVSLGERDRVTMRRWIHAAHIHIGTLSLCESGESTRTVILRGLMKRTFTPGEESCTLRLTASLICAGGWPTRRGLPLDQAQPVAEKQINKALELTHAVRKKKLSTLHWVLAAIAQNAGTESTYASISHQLSAHMGKLPSRTTVLAYIRALEDTYLVDTIPGWIAPIRSSSRARSKNRLIPCDPSILPCLLDMGPDDIMVRGDLMRAGLYTLVYRDLRSLMTSLGHDAPDSIMYYSDADGLDIDFILSFSQGGWAAVNVVLGEPHVPNAAKRLARLERKIRANPESLLPAPLFKAVITASAHRRWVDAETGVYVFPITSLAQ